MVTLAAVCFATASATKPLGAMDRSGPLPPADIPNVSSGGGPVAYAPDGAKLMWGGPVPPAAIPGGSDAYVPSRAYGDPEPVYRAPEPAQSSRQRTPETAYEPPSAAVEEAAPAIRPDRERRPGDYGRTYPVQEAPRPGASNRTSSEGAPLVRQASLPALRAPTVIDDAMSVGSYGSAPGDDVDYEDTSTLRDEPPPPVTPVRPGRGALESQAPSGYRALPKSEAMCRRELQKLGVRFTEVSQIGTGGACGIEHPVKVSQALNGIAMSPPATLNCRTALKVARWLKEDVKPAARWKLWTQPTAVLNASSYRCTRIAGSRTVSEHGGGNALDVSGFRFADGSTVKVEPKGFFSFRERGFQKSVRQASCRHFGTVLGPGYNRAHADHLHLDGKQRRRPVCK